MIRFHVVHAERFVSKKNNKVYTKLFVPVRYDMYPVFCEGDVTHLVGTEATFRLGVRDGQLQLFYDSDGKEE